jgi:hemerythrin-like metal-binding protein
MDPEGWREEYNFNVKFIDDQHKYFFRTMNKLRECIDEGNCAIAGTDIFFELAHYVEHFLIQEEIYFKDYQFPNYNKHKKLHNDFIERFIKFQKDFESRSDKVCSDMLEFLEGWFDNHILKYDKEAIDYLTERGIE